MASRRRAPAEPAPVPPAEGEPAREASLGPARYLVQPGTYNGGLTHGGNTPLDLGADEDGNPVTCDLQLEAHVVALYGGDPTLSLQVTCSPSGHEADFAPVGDPIDLSTEGVTPFTVSGVYGSIRAEFTIDGTGPAVAFGIRIV